MRQAQTFQRFCKKFEVTQSCWNWRAGKTRDGYGRFRVVNRMVLAHRLSYEIHRGFIPAGLEIDHLCRNRACVNPWHLEPVFHQQNVLRGVNPMAQYARRKECVRGHEYDSANTYWRGRERVCRACCREKQNAWRQRKKAIA